jgi:putative FmdB family regulatory protein
MPTYTYRCDSCGHKFDIVQRMSDDPLAQCPACQAVALVKEIQPVGFALKGTGWYVTDFRDKGKPAKPAEGDAGKGEAAKPEAETKTETKTDSKADTKTESKSAAVGAAD